MTPGWAPPPSELLVVLGQPCSSRIRIFKKKTALIWSLTSSASWEGLSLTLTCPTRRSELTLSAGEPLLEQLGKTGKAIPTLTLVEAWVPARRMDRRGQDAGPLLASGATGSPVALLRGGSSCGNPHWLCSSLASLQ